MSRPFGCKNKPKCICPPDCTDEACEVCIPNAEPVVKKPRGRPKGSKNKAKVVIPDTDADGTPIVLEPESGEVGNNIVCPTIPNADGTTCEDCKEYLTCEKITNLDSLPPTCQKFFNNFIVDNDTETEEAIKDVESIVE